MKNGDDRIRLLHLTQSLRVGGAETLLCHYIEALGTDRYEHYCYCFGGDGLMRKRLEKVGAEVLVVPKRQSVKNPLRFIVCIAKLVAQLSLLLRQLQIDVVQSHLANGNQLGVLVGALTGVPVYATVHSTMAFAEKRSRFDVRVYLGLVVNAIVYRRADRIIAVSKEVKQIVKKRWGLKENDIVVVENGIVCDEPKTGSSLGECNGKVAQSSVEFLGVGSLSHHKGFDVLIRAVSDVLNCGIGNIHVSIFGTGQEFSVLKELIHSLMLQDHVFLMGTREDVLAVMRSSDVFVLPSRYEGRSMAMIEAMASGLPIIASDAPGINDYIEDEKTGLLFPIGDHEALSKQIVRIVEDVGLRRALSVASRECYERDFDMKKNIKVLDQLMCGVKHQSDQG